MSTLLLASAVALATPANSDASDRRYFAACDGYGAPTRKVDGMTKSTWLWGLASSTSDIRRSTSINLGRAGADACEQALADPMLLPDYWLRRANLLQARALHAFVAGDTDVALRLLDESDALGTAQKSGTFEQSLGLGNLAIRAFIHGEKGDADAARATAARMIALRPWSLSNLRLTSALTDRLDPIDVAQKNARARLKFLPGNAAPLAIAYFERGQYQEALDVAGLIDFALPKMRGGWYIEGAADRDVKIIETRAIIGGMRAYAANAVGNPALASQLLAAARAELDAADTPPQPQADGVPPRKSAVREYNRRLPFINAGRREIAKWEGAIAFAAKVPTMPMESVFSEFMKGGFNELGIQPDILRRMVATDSSAAAERDRTLGEVLARLTQVQRKRESLSATDLAALLPRPETPKMVPVMKPAGDGYFLSDTGLSRARSKDADEWTIRFTHPVASIETVEEMAMMGAAQTAIEQKKDGFVILTSRSFARTMHVSNTFYGVVMSQYDTNAGYEAQLRVQFVDSTAMPPELADMGWRVIKAGDVIASLSSKYRRSGGVTIAW